MLQEKYLFEDQPLEEMIVPIDGVTLAVESGGELIFGRLELPAVQNKEERTPLLLMMHGHPGISRNIDLAMALRRAGIATCYFSYRGIWGSRGDYTFSHVIEDTQAMFAYLQAHADEWRLDPKRFYVLGHSMGGFSVMNCLAQGMPARGAILMAPCNTGFLAESQNEVYKGLTDPAACMYFTLRHDMVLREDAEQHQEEWKFENLAEKIDPDLPIHFIVAIHDDITPPAEHIAKAYKIMENRGMKVSHTLINDSHSFPAARNAVALDIFRAIEKMEQ